MNSVKTNFWLYRTENYCLLVWSNLFQAFNFLVIVNPAYNEQIWTGNVGMFDFFFCSINIMFNSGFCSTMLEQVVFLVHKRVEIRFKLFYVLKIVSYIKRSILMSRTNSLFLLFELSNQLLSNIPPVLILTAQSNSVHLSFTVLLLWIVRFILLEL